MVGRDGDPFESRRRLKPRLGQRAGPGLSRRATFVSRRRLKYSGEHGLLSRDWFRVALWVEAHSLVSSCPSNRER